MKNFLRNLVYGGSIVVLFVPLGLHAKIEGTYALEDNEESRYKWTQMELTIEADDEGEYSATLTKKSGEVLLETKDVQVDEKKFEATFTSTSGLGEFDITYAGQIKDKKLSGTISESLFGSEVKLVGRLRTRTKSPLTKKTNSIAREELGLTKRSQRHKLSKQKSKVRIR